MTRRQLLAALASAAVAPDELWAPSRSIFLPPRGGWLGRDGLIISQQPSVLLAYDAKSCSWEVVSPDQLTAARASAARAYFQPREVVKVVSASPGELTVLRG